MSPFVGDGFMYPFPSHADSCFYSLMTATPQPQLCRKGRGRKSGHLAGTVLSSPHLQGNSPQTSLTVPALGTHTWLTLTE